MEILLNICLQKLRAPPNTEEGWFPKVKSALLRKNLPEACTQPVLQSETAE